MKTTRTKVYLAGPITGGGNVLANIRHALQTARTLLWAGYAPYIPHLSCYWETVCAIPVEDMIALDCEYLAVCDVLLRLPGTSPGADREVVMADELGLRVYTNIDDLLQHERAELAHVH